LPREPNFVPVIQGVEFFNQAGQPMAAVPIGAPLTIHIYYKHHELLKDPYFGMTFETPLGVKVFWVQTRLQRGTLPDLPKEGMIACHIPRLPLIPGTYLLSPGCGSGMKQLDYISRGCQLEVIQADVFGTGRLPPSSHAVVIVDADWEIST
jgi:hypothetical protein